MQNITLQKKWSLFLDRDGVINEEIKNDYVRRWDMFRFCQYALDSFPIFNEIFGKIFIVTNQRGIGKGLMKEKDLFEIHEKMKDSIVRHGGRIDHIFFSSGVTNEDPYRKPNIGMGLHAKEIFPDIEFNHSVMIGNSWSDMKFGKSLGMYTCLVTSDKYYPEDELYLVDHASPNLYEIAKFLKIYQVV